MPWSANDSTRFKKDINPGAKDRWAAVANWVLQRTGDESKAIKIANGVTRSAASRRLGKRSKTGVGGFK